MFETNKDEQMKALKQKIKAWELDFAKSNHRKPKKEDIYLASSDVKEAYKSYWTLKNKNELKNQNDVWGKKFNKSHKGNLKVNSSDEHIKKICNKIRERSTLNHPVRNKKPDFIHLKSESHLNTTDKNESCVADIYNISVNYSMPDLVTETQLIKPTNKVLKFDTSYRKIKSVNVLSPSANFKGPKNLSFESSLDNDWLERCCNDILNDSQYCVESSENISSSSKENASKYVFDTDVHVNIKTIHDDESENIKLHHISVDKDNCSDNNSFDMKKLNSSSVTNRMLTPVKEKQIVVLSNMEFDMKNNNEKQMPDCHMETKPKTEVSDVTETKFEHRKSRKRKLTGDALVHKSSHLERKMSAGTLSENFVKVNIKKKKFSRGHHSVNVKKLKWKKWKDLKKFREDGGNILPSACFKCGQTGHWARNCKIFREEVEFSESNENIDDAPLPTLEEAAELAKKSKTNLLKVNMVKGNECAVNLSCKVKENISEKVCIDLDIKSNDINDEIIRPIFADRKLNETPQEVFDALKELGYKDFRAGQETAVMRILAGLSTLVVLPTGSGKTLCYQLPAYIYAKQFKCMTLVISPLVSLMEDQVTGLSSVLHAVCLHSGMTDIQKKDVLQDLRDGKAHILLVSPETVISGFTMGFSLPPISFACIDEAHCLSQWSHNFRPSYLQLYKVLTQRMKVRCILGLTATANLSTIKEIASLLDLQNMEESVVCNTGIPENLHLSASRDKDKDKALIHLLSGDRFKNCFSIIIYCIRRDETERLAALIRTCLQDQTSEENLKKKKNSKSKKMNFIWTAEAYHAGLPPPRRRSIQKQFMSGKLRVVVATIAFGMGLNKRDVRAVIHYNMPKSFESYVQEIGRAGRDGLVSHCHLFLDNEGKDMQELRRHIYSNSTDRHIIRKLLRKVFVPCDCKKSAEECFQANELLNAKNLTYPHFKCPKHEIAFPIDDAVQELDLKEENILTLLCYLELSSNQWIEVLPPTYATCIIRCYGGPKQLRNLALKSAPVAAAFALDTKKGKKLENISAYELAPVEVASHMGWNAASVKHELKQLEWNDHKRKTGVIVNFSNLAFHFNAPGNLSDDELDDALDFLHNKVVNSEKTELQNLKSLFSIFTKYSYPHYWACCDETPVEFSDGIKKAINEYFDETENYKDIMECNDHAKLNDSIEVDESDVRSQIKDIIYTNTDQNFTGRAIARIFHGIGSPCYPPEVWGKVRNFWRCLLHVNFNYLIKLANEELKNSK